MVFYQRNHNNDESYFNASNPSNHTSVVYESSHRIVACLQDMAEVFGQERHIVMGRELTKKFETIAAGTVDQLAQKVQNDPNQTKGEFVVAIRGLDDSKATSITPRAHALIEGL